MANYFNLILDTTAPASPSIVIEGGASFTADQLVNCTIGTGDQDVTGYQMKIWGDVDNSHNPSIQKLEANSVWITYSTSAQVYLSAQDGTKELNVKIRDDVYNESSQASDTITLSASLPTVTVGTVDVLKISKISGKDTSSFTFTFDKDVIEYKVKFVSSVSSGEGTGVQIGTSFGSTNMSNTGLFPSSTPIVCSIKGADLESATSGDGSKIIKVFVKDQAGNWSA